jgi:co-chaperonin GroES (HSP10)
VFCSKYGGTEIKLDGEYLILREEEIWPIERRRKSRDKRF